ncbi:hypothetical protein [Mycoplasmopsis caviae]|uniref:Uncharacterized protein n=1 Tax=Mycoplasmopsis caviae TaxID=55603 RepID=A0A3P8L824_9BACT|nr:hypothetical protein [Mycoplasmopsis caviae]VDR42515.1 Uncharacterised protein [Mycoplasmopsis caviae]
MEAKLDNKVVSFHEAGGDESATISEINTNKFQVAFPGALRYYQEYQNNKNKSVSAFMQTKALLLKLRILLNLMIHHYMM